MFIPFAFARYFSRLTFLFLSLCLFNSTQALAAVAGDVAPQGAHDNLLTAADITLVQKFVSGEITPTVTEVKLSDVYPQGAPDGIVDANDVTLLNQALLGQVTLPAVTLIAAPTLTNPGFSSTLLNPIPLSGTAVANSIVQVYVNGIFQDSATAAANGTFTVNTALVDGVNSIFAIAINANTPSSNSNSISVTYTNTVSRVQGGSITGNVVWTPGSPAQPYSISGSDLVVPVGAKLVLQPGTELQFASGRTLTVNGTLSIRGGKTNKVKLLAAGGLLSPGAWVGVSVANTATNLSIENATIESATQGIVVDGVAAQIKNNTIRYFSTDGIYIKNAGASTSLVQGNIVDNNIGTGICLTTDTSSPTIKGNNLLSCYYGLHIKGNSSPLVNSNNIIANNRNGILFSSATLTTLPTINGNQIFNNATRAVEITPYADVAQGIKLNFLRNWWGSANPSVISSEIYDATDSPTSLNLATVDYSNFLIAPGGTPVDDNYLIGSLSATTTTLTAGATYSVLGSIFLSAGKTLIIPAGTVLKFYGVSQLIVNGTLNVQGTSVNKVKFTSANAVPAPGDWKGIWIKSGTGSIVDNAIIEYAEQSILVDNVAAQIKNNTLRYFRGEGIRVLGAGASASVIQGNTVNNIDEFGHAGGICIAIDASSPSIKGNSLSNCSYGLHIIGKSLPSINSNNIITNNYTGILLSGETFTTLPTINGNQIFGNTNRALEISTYTLVPQPMTLNATGNWWGSSDPSVISSAISDFTDSPTSLGLVAMVDYSNFLGAPSGVPILANYLAGFFTAAATTLTAGTTYDVLGVLYVPVGNTLTIPAGTVLKFHGNSQLIVEGTLNVQGTTLNKVKFTSGRIVTNRGDWNGISIKNGTGSIIDNAIVEYTTQGIVVDGTSAQIKNSTIRHFESDGIKIDGSNASASLIQGNIVDNVNDTAICLSVNISSPTVQTNTLTNCNVGLLIINNSSPLVNANNIITNNYNGVVFSGALPILPVITGNQIFHNSVHSVEAIFTDPGAQNIKLNFSGNWWGSTDPNVISSTIYDLTDSPRSVTLATVDYSNFLNAPSGTQVTGNYLIGSFTATTTTLTAGTTYDVLGALYVPSGKTLVIPAGTILKFNVASAQLVVDGTLSVQGTSTNKVKFTSGRSSPVRGDWNGIVIQGGSGSIIDNAIVEYTTQGILVDNLVAQIKNSTIRNFTLEGIRLVGSGASGSLLQGNLIDNVNVTVLCLAIQSSSPSVKGNTLTNCAVGLNIIGSSSPQVNTNNIITSNTYGVTFSNTPLTALPVVTGNQIFSNANLAVDASGYYEIGAQNINLNFSGNWWGSIDPSVISKSIYDLTDSPWSTLLPTVNYGSFLNAAGGTQVVGNYLMGSLTAASTTLTAGKVYDVLGATFVPAGKTLIIPAGTILRFTPGAKLEVSGSLTISGTATNQVILTSAKILPAASDWVGVVIKNTATAVNIQNAVVQYAANGIYIDNTASVVNVSNSLLQLCDVGLYINGNTKPVVATTRVVSNATTGIYIFGNNIDATDPKPVLKNNDVYNNAGSVLANINVVNYTTTPTIKIDVTNNWWGTSTPTFTSTALNFTPVRVSASLAPIVNSHSITNSFFSPNSDTVQDTATVTSTISETASWALDVKNLTTGAVVRTYTGSGVSQNVVWDGKNASAVTQADGRYGLITRTTASTRTGMALYREVVLDNTLPTASLDSLLSLLPQKNVLNIPINGSANDQNFLNYSVDFTNNLLPVVWNSLSANIIYATNNTLLSTWAVGNTLGNPVVANGTYTLRLVVKDLAGNQKLVTTSVTIENLTLTNVIAPTPVNLITNTSAPINFTINIPGAVTVKIYDVSEGANSFPVRTLTLNAVAGLNSISWNGRDQLGARVQKGAFVFVIEASDGSHVGRYDPTNVVDRLVPIADIQDVNTNCDAIRNTFASVSVTTPERGLLGIAVVTSFSEIIYPFGINGTPVPAGTTILYWDCRDPLTGALVSLPAGHFSSFLRYPPNIILVDGVDGSAKIKGTGVNVEVKSDPYLIYLSYGQFTKISYSLALFGATTTQVDIKLLPPSVLNFDDADAVLVFSGVQSAGDQQITWKGEVGTVENSKRATSRAEGAYTFAIKTTTNGVSSIYRGTLSVYQ
jgi:nitrous oxidase accessory protein NosD